MSTPRFLLDEHVWGGLVKVGEQIGADVVLVQTQLPKGTDDEEILAFAANEERILLTSNAQDFAPLVAKWFLTDQEHWGVIIVPGQTNKSLLSRALRNIVQDYDADSFKNTYRFIQDFA
jgi:predicted nuclease of predicted toxin-antitoxin system